MKFWRLWRAAEVVKEETDSVLLDSAPSVTEQNTKTPVIDAKVAQAKSHNASVEKHSKAANKISQSEETVSYVVHKHPFFFILKMFKHWLVLLPFALLLVYVVPFYATPIEVLLLNIVLLFLMVSAALVAFVHWHMNVSLVFPETLQTFYFHNILRQHHEGIELERLNTFDLEKRGLLPYILNYADLNLSTVVKESDAEDKLKIRRVWKPEEALKVIKYYADGHESF